MNDSKDFETPQPQQTSPKRELKVDAYRSWLVGLKKQVDEGTMSFTEFSDLVAQKMFARDEQLQRQTTLRKALEFQVKNDKLVDLRNEDAYDDYVDQLLKSGENFGLLLVDLDHFGDANETLGHAGGDEALIKTAQRLSVAVRGKDNIDEDRKRDEVFRLHGDELAVLIPGLNPDDKGRETLKEIAERMKKAMENPLQIKTTSIDTSWDATLSIGGGIFEGGTPESFRDKVDKTALYQAKAEGRNRSFILGLDKPIKQASADK